jgi:lipopolysaccharide transport system ATP-binding protein
MAPILRCRGVGLRYRLIEEGSASFKGALLNTVRGRPSREHWALRGFDLEVGAGEVVGLVGRNGSGKSSLCRLVAGILRPDEGEVSVRGRVSPVLGVGVGFQDELTGRDNLYLSGAFQGFSRAALRAKLPEIVAFAELEGFLDVPVKRWSTGMRARLGFSLAVHSRGDLLVLDEVLAVGDEGFRARCLQRLRGWAAEGRALLMVSHDGALLSELCERLVWLEGGRVAATGPPAGVMRSYRAALGSPGSD